MKTAGSHGFYPVVDDVDWVRRFLPLGVRTIQLRIKGQPESAVRRQIREALAVAADYDDCQLIINDYWQESIREGATWLHLGQEDLAGADLAAIRAAGIRLGVSTHSALARIARKSWPMLWTPGPITLPWGRSTRRH